MAIIVDEQITIHLKGEALRLNFASCGHGDPAKNWVLLHGMGSSRLAYRPMMERWPFPGKVYAVDLPGFGASGHLKQPHSLDDYVAAVGALMDERSIDHPVILGHSFGGLVAAEVIAQLPHRVKGGVLVSSAGFFPPQNALTPTRHVWLNRIGIWVTGLEYFGLRMVRALGLDPAILTRNDRRRLQYGWRHAIEMARMPKFYEDPDLLEKIVAAKRPIAFIHGDRDPLFPLAELRQVIGLTFPIWVMPSAGHLPYDTDLDYFLDILRQAVQPWL